MAKFTIIFLLFFVKKILFFNVLFTLTGRLFNSPIIFNLIPCLITFLISVVKYFLIKLNKKFISFFGLFQFSDEKT